MDKRSFKRLVKAHGLRGRSRLAAERVLVAGESAYAVSQAMVLAESTISRALTRLARPLCSACGQPVKGKKR